MYDPTNSQQTAQFAINPFQVAQIGIFDIDRSFGQFFPQFEGDSIYVEGADFPVILTLVDQTNGFERSVVLSNGLEISARFKGFTLTHPLLQRVVASDQFSLKLVVGKSGNKENSYVRPNVSSPFTGLRVLGNSAAQFTFALALPPGARYLEKLQFACTATTITDSTTNCGTLDSAGNFAVCSGPTWIQNGKTYGGIGPFSRGKFTAAGAAIIVDDGDLQIPTYAKELLLTVNGTGLVGGPIYTKAIFS